MIPEMAQPSGGQFRVALIGSRGVGKTSWLRRNLTGEFRENYIPTSWKDKEIRDLKFSTRDGDSIVLTFETK